mgnify:CR=1 FL=1
MIIKRDGTETVLNTDKIKAAIKAAYETFSITYETFLSKISALLNEIIENMWAFLKRNFGWFVEKIHSFRKKHRSRFPWLTALPVLKISVDKSYVKLLVLAFETAACRIRTIYLQRTQHRGSNYSNDEIVISF